MPRSLRIFLVEDESLVAMLIEDMLTDLGHEVTHKAARIAEAIDIARSGFFDLAILDLNLGGEPSYPVAAILRDRGIRFVFSTGYGKLGVSPEFSAVPLLTKPFVRAEMEKLLSRLSGS